MADFDKSMTQHPRYFPGQYLLADDFELQHEYLAKRQIYHNKSLHVSGIIEGLDVADNDGKSVNIKSGSAIDSNGDLIILKNTEEGFDKFNNLTEGELFIEYISKSGVPQQTTEDTHTRFLEEPIIKFAATTSNKGVKLAKLTISGGTIKIDPSIREYSGISLPNSDSKALTLRSGGNANPNLAVLTGSLKIEENLTVEGTGKSEFAGSLTVKKQLQIIDTNQDANGKTLILGPSGRLRLGCHQDYSWIQSHGSKPLAINPIGNNVGIGTTDPGDYKLKVQGSQCISGDLTVEGSGTELEQEDWNTAEINDQYWATPTDYSPEYFKDSLGIVHLKGAVIKKTSDKYNTIFTLASGYQPSGVMYHAAIFFLLSSNALIAGIIVIDNNGIVQAISLQNPSLENTTIFLEGITFRAAQ